MKSLALAFLLFSVVPVISQERKELYYGPTGEKLVEQCKNITVLEPARKGSAVQLTRCLDYITGVVDGAMMATAKAPTDFPACIPTQETVGDFAHIVMKYSETHPEYKTKVASDLVLTAIHSAFPCGK
jgi:hypothetical protein